MRSMVTPIAAALAALAVSAATADAALIAKYEFTGGTAASTATAPQVTAGNAAWTGVAAGYSSTSGTTFVRADVAPSAMDVTKYLTFTVAAAEGYKLDLNSLTFALGASTENSISYTTSAQLRSNANSDQFATSLILNPGATDTGSVTTLTATTYETFTADLSAPAYQNLSQITFRVYPFDTLDSVNRFVRFDDIALDGAVTLIPEPAALSVLGLGSVCLLRRGRRAAMKRTRA